MKSSFSRTKGWVAGLVVVVAGFGFWQGKEIFKANRIEADLRAVVAETSGSIEDAWDRGALERKRTPVSEGENSARIVAEASSKAPKDHTFEFLAILVPDHPCVRLSPDLAETLRKDLAPLEPALIVARRLIDHPNGRYPPPAGSAGRLLVSLEHLVELDQVADWLFFDGIHRCQDKDLRGAWESALALIHAGRSVGDEPTWQAMATRMKATERAMELLERILGHGEIGRKDLETARKFLAAERQADFVTRVIHGERIVYHGFFGDLADGKIDLTQIKELQGLPSVKQRHTRSEILASHAEILRFLLRASECARQKGRFRYACFRKLDFVRKEAMGAGTLPALAHDLAPNIPALAFAEQSHFLRMDCALAALSAEVFRLEKGRWPKGWDESIAAGMLASVPEDLEDDAGRPLEFRSERQGIVVGPRRELAHRTEDDPPPSVSLDRRRAFHLWHPDRRGRPPAPEPEDGKEEP